MIGWGVVLGVGLLCTAPDEPAPRRIDYVREIKPILAGRCSSCHGAIRQKAGLRLDTAALAREGGESGPALEPGRADESLLLDRVTTSDLALRMPPENEVPLAPAEIALLRDWINQGALAPNEPIPPDPREHWAYRPLQRPAVPTAAWADGAPCDNPIDAFSPRRIVPVA
ncbi:MAG: c-type cytochrome domain-containing protein [Isosphaeraceae bacterium]